MGSSRETIVTAAKGPRLHAARARTGVTPARLALLVLAWCAGWHLATGVTAAAPAEGPAPSPTAASHEAGGAPAQTRQEREAALRAAKYVYIATQRRDGSYGAPAEIWFMFHDGAVWVASPPTTWRVRRIRAGRAKARIALARGAEPAFTATGSIVKDEAIAQRLYTTYAEKYGDAWKGYEERFRKGLADGSRVLIKYQLE